MHVERVSDAAEFLRRTHDLRGRQPALTNVLGSVASGVVAGRRYDDEAWWVVVHPDGAVAGAAIRTAPWPVLASPMPAAAAAAIADRALQDAPDVPGVVAPPPVASVVLARWGRREVSRMVEAVMVLERLAAPTGVPGRPEVAVAADLPRMLEWSRQFAVDAGLPGHDSEEGMRWRVEQRSLWWWTVAGEPVSMAGFAPAVQTPAGRYVRLGPVYTPAPLRGRGYAGAVTAALADHLSADGATVMLHADAANRTSVGLYERLGFRSVGELLDVTLAPC